MNTRIYIVYDSILNTVFDSQVLLYLKNTAQNYDETIIISFEKSPNSPELIQKVAHLKKQYRIYVYRSYPFIHPIQLLLHRRSIRKIIKNIKDYTLVARGPLAGFIAQNSRTKLCKKIIIQARGLLAQEYTFTKKRRNLRSYVFHRLEKKVYSNKQSYIEAVSPALKNYLVETFGTNKNQCTIAQSDLPKKITEKERSVWHKKIRKELKISEKAYVYCYNGSAKPWQCPNETIEYFVKKYRTNRTSVLLVLTKDSDIFKRLLTQRNFPEGAYRIISVPHKEVYRYLCACNAGLLFRTHHPVNWTSRPTKALEYYAAGLEVIHNMTVAYLSPQADRGHI